MNNEEEIKEISNEEKVENNNHYETEKEVDKDVISNEELMKKKIDSIMSDLDDVDKQEEIRKTTKKVFMTLIVIAEAIIIVLIVKKMLLK